jgi:hypothetical protein
MRASGFNSRTFRSFRIAINVDGAIIGDEGELPRSLCVAEDAAERTTVGEASLSEMEPDHAAVDGLKSSALVKLQELSIGSDQKAPLKLSSKMMMRTDLGE